MELFHRALRREDMIKSEERRMQKHKKKKEMIEMLLKKGIFMTAAALTAS